MQQTYNNTGACTRSYTLTHMNIHTCTPPTHPPTSASQIAMVFEFGGAMLLGRVSTSTIAGGIADTSTFASQPVVWGGQLMLVWWGRG